MVITERNNVKVSGSGRPIIFAHGYGCDQHMWRLVAPAFESDYQVILFDYVGSGSSDLKAYHEGKYSDLHGYAQDVLDIIDELKLKDVIFVGHSVSSMVGLLASIRNPQAFSKIIMLAPSPCYTNDGDYIGGFEKNDIDGLLQSLEDNQLGWSQQLAPMVMANKERPELTAELAAKFCAIDHAVAINFARATFYSDHRKDLENGKVRTLILQCSDDIIAPIAVGEYLRRQIPYNQYVHMKATGHFPQLSAPVETIEEIKKFL